MLTALTRPGRSVRFSAMLNAVAAVVLLVLALGPGWRRARLSKSLTANEAKPAVRRPNR